CWLALSSDAMNSARCWLVTLRSLPILMLWSWPVRSRKYTLSRPTCRISATCSTVYACTARLTSSLSSLLLVVACRGHEAGTSIAVTVRDCLGLSTSCVSSPLRADARVDSRHRQLLWVIGDGSPAAVAEPGGLATAGRLMPVASIRSGTELPCSGERDRAVSRMAAGLPGASALPGPPVSSWPPETTSAGWSTLSVRAAWSAACRDTSSRTGLIWACGPAAGADGFVGEQVRAGTA